MAIRDRPCQDWQGHFELLLMQLDVVGQNYLSQEREGGIVNTEVTLAALAGDWLASVEHWSDADLGPETRLKFWRFDDALQKWVHLGFVGDAIAYFWNM